jgi:hypothetical protein
MPSTTPVTTGSNTTTVITHTIYVNTRHIFAGPEIIILVLGILSVIAFIIVMIGLLINWDSDGTPWDKKRKYRLEVMRIQAKERDDSRVHDQKISMLHAAEMKLQMEKMEKEAALLKKSLTA